jgi:predicted GNAT superfamily acetyltransferase
LNISILVQTTNGRGEQGVDTLMWTFDSVDISNFVNNFSALSAELVGEMNDVLAEATLDN